MKLFIGAKENLGVISFEKYDLICQMKEARHFKGVDYPHNFRIYAKYKHRGVEPKHGDIIGETRTIHSGYPTALLVWMVDRHGEGFIMTISEERYHDFMALHALPKKKKKVDDDLNPLEDVDSETFADSDFDDLSDPLGLLLSESNAQVPPTKYEQFLREFPVINSVIINILASKIDLSLLDDYPDLTDELFYLLLNETPDLVTESEFKKFVSEYPILSQILFGLVVSKIKYDNI